MFVPKSLSLSLSQLSFSPLKFVFPQKHKQSILLLHEILNRREQYVFERSLVHLSVHYKHIHSVAKLIETLEDPFA